MAVRFIAPEMTSIEFSSSYFSLFKSSEISSEPELETISPEIKLSAIKFPIERKSIKKSITKIKATSSLVASPKWQVAKIAPRELPFHEPVKLVPVVLNTQLPENLTALYVDIRPEQLLAQPEPVKDEISSKLAATAEPEFFDYTTETIPSKTEEKTESKTLVETIVDNSTDVENSKPVENLTEEIAIEELITFDYSKAGKDIQADTMPKVSKVTTHGTATEPKNLALRIDWNTKSKSGTSSSPVATHEESPAGKATSSGDKLMSPVTKGHPNRVTIQLTGTDLNKVRNEVGFEVRFQDDLSEIYQDYNEGKIVIDQDLSGPKMTRAMTVLKRGYAPTNTDLILEEGVHEVVLPAIEESAFNELLAPYGGKGPIGAVLVELDDSVEEATLDEPFTKVLHLDQDMKVTEDQGFVYQLFLGVKAGNVMLSYKTRNGEKISKIIHVHEHELSFETNFFEAVSDETVALFEEDLLSREKLPLIISSDQVREFATEKVSKKLNDHTYKLHFNKTLLGGRRYLELGHQNEPIYIGLKDNNTVDIPSESLMRHMLSRFEGSSLGNRCLVQVNLSKKATKYDVTPESAGQSLVTYAQVLDADGRFYDSIGAKTRKIVIVGENQGAPGVTLDSRINIKVSYVDGTVQFLSTYCSPNTYLVEQL